MPDRGARSKRGVRLDLDEYEPTMVPYGQEFICVLMREGEWAGLNTTRAVRTGCELPDGFLSVPTLAVLRAANHFYWNIATRSSYRVHDGVLGLYIPGEFLASALVAPSGLEVYTNERIGFREDIPALEAGTWVRDGDFAPVMRNLDPPPDWIPTGDAVLDRLRVKPEDFRVEQMLTYFYERFRLCFGYDYPEDPHRDRTCLQNALVWYREHAVGLVRYVFEQCGGMVAGEPITTSVFSRGARWKADDAYNSYRVSNRPVADLSDFISAWTAK